MIEQYDVDFEDESWLNYAWYKIGPELQLFNFPKPSDFIQYLRLNLSSDTVASHFPNLYQAMDGSMEKVTEYLEFLECQLFAMEKSAEKFYYSVRVKINSCKQSATKNILRVCAIVPQVVKLHSILHSELVDPSRHSEAGRGR